MRAALILCLLVFAPLGCSEAHDPEYPGVDSTTIDTGADAPDTAPPTCGTPCNSGDPCGLGVVDCETGACIVSEPARDGTTCAVGSVCDGGVCVAEECVEGANCTNPSAPCAIGTLACSGPTIECVIGGPRPAGTPCRTRAGPCDIEEQCTGDRTACPADSFQAASALCRPSSGVCDAEDFCDGTSAACPPDAFAPVGTPCPGGGSCAGAAGCLVGCSSAPCSVPGEPCANGIIDCSAGAPTCVSAGPEPAGTTCRAATSECDLEEVCDGSSTLCPADDVAPDGTMCAGGVCDGGGGCGAP